VTGDVLLTGAGKVGGNYYLATMGQGLYSSADGSVITQVATTPSVNLVGLLQAEVEESGVTKEILIGISAGGYIVYIDAAGPRVDPTSLGGTCTGALALMDIPNPSDEYDKLLLYGYKGGYSSYEHGYMELKFKSSDGSHDGIRRIPGNRDGGAPSSISDYRQYDSSLRRYPVAALWVLDSATVSEESPAVIFAATNNQGLYSYRERSDGGWQWNHEE
jgi:hypothetical protein